MRERKERYRRDRWRDIGRETKGRIRGKRYRADIETDGKTERRNKGERQVERWKKRYKRERRKTKNTKGKESWRE